MVYREDQSEVRVNDRISSGPFYATVKFIGVVPPTEGEWLGVDWDANSRGKHDGTKDGVHYFHTRNDSSGSFIRPSKSNLGRSCLAAIKDRYGKADDETAGVQVDELYVISSTLKQTAVQVVGAKKVNDRQSQLHELREVMLHDMSIYGSGAGVMHEHTPNITELDLSRNLLSSWTDVASITRQLPCLVSLDVSDNRLSVPAQAELLSDGFLRLESIFMNRMKYTWSQILQCSSMFPALRFLHTCFNEIRQLAVPSPTQFGLVELMNLEGNCITNWEEFLKIGCLPQLTRLILSGNGFSSIDFPDASPQCNTSYFTKVRSLSLNYTHIADWSAIGQLNKLPCLSELTMNNCPLNHTSSTTDVRSQMVAKLSHLTTFNRTMINMSERRSSEYEYVKAHYTEWKDAGGHVDPSLDKTEPQFMIDHPRLSTLVRLHGEPESSELVNVTHTIRDHLISVTISDNNKTFKKRLPVGMSVQKLIGLIQKLYKKDCDVRLSYRTPEMPDMEFRFDNHMRDLAFYSLENNDTIFVRWNDHRIKYVPRAKHF